MLLDGSARFELAASERTGKLEGHRGRNCSSTTNEFSHVRAFFFFRRDAPSRDATTNLGPQEAERNGGVRSRAGTTCASDIVMAVNECKV